MSVGDIGICFHDFSVKESYIHMDSNQFQNENALVWTGLRSPADHYIRELNLMEDLLYCSPRYFLHAQMTCWRKG